MSYRGNLCGRKDQTRTTADVRMKNPHPPVPPLAELAPSPVGRGALHLELPQTKKCRRFPPKAPALFSDCSKRSLSLPPPPYRSKMQFRKESLRHKRHPLR